MYVCMYISIYMHIYMCVYVCIYIYMKKEERHPKRIRNFFTKAFEFRARHTLLILSILVYINKHDCFKDSRN